MNYYWAIIIIVIESMATLFLASRYAVDLKHSYDPNYNPTYRVNLPRSTIYRCPLWQHRANIILYFLKADP